jgi:hypothetical protein
MTISAAGQIRLSQIKNEAMAQTAGFDREDQAVVQAELTDLMKQEQRREAKDQMIKAAQTGWVRITIITVIFLALIMNGLQRAANVPVFSVLTDDPVTVRKRYAGANVILAQAIVAGLLVGILFALYKLLKRSNYDLGAFVVGGKYAQRKSNRFSTRREQDMRKVARMERRPTGPSGDVPEPVLYERPSYDSNDLPESGGGAFDEWDAAVGGDNGGDADNKPADWV